ncbi:MAG TPA: hypothetical protein VGW38_00700 [Chloroflexota bacterium]|nr:hypothetical protein [Chloroflexota bacterium]
MPIEEATLDATVRAYVATMPSIRGRRVHRLLMREFARFDHVLPAAAEDGSVSVCQTDGRGEVVAIAEWRRLEGATVKVSYNLTKDSLPIVGWTISHPGFDRAAGTLTIAAADISRSEHQRITNLLRTLGG